MAYSEKHAQIFRTALDGIGGITENRMFGGLCFLLNGNMLCGVHKDGGMARVGKDNEAAALELPAWFRCHSPDDAWEDLWSWTRQQSKMTTRARPC